MHEIIAHSMLYLAPNAAIIIEKVCFFHQIQSNPKTTTQRLWKKLFIAMAIPYIHEHSCAQSYIKFVAPGHTLLKSLKILNGFI